MCVRWHISKTRHLTVQLSFTQEQPAQLTSQPMHRRFYGEKVMTAPTLTLIFSAVAAVGTIVIVFSMTRSWYEPNNSTIG